MIFFIATKQTRCLTGLTVNSKKLHPNTFKCGRVWPISQKIWDNENHQLITMFILVKMGPFHLQISWNSFTPLISNQLLFVGAGGLSQTSKGTSYKHFFFQNYLYLEYKQPGGEDGIQPGDLWTTWWRKRWTIERKVRSCMWTLCLLQSDLFLWNGRELQCTTHRK